MKKLYSLILCLVMTFLVCGVTAYTVNADEATLSEMKVEAQNNAGERTEVVLSPEFSADVTEYNATVANDTIKLVITATTTEEGADYETDWEALDVGDNKTFVYVTAADGTKQTYTIYAKRLTKDEEATYVAPEVEEDEEPADGDDTNDTEGTEEKSKIVVGDTEMKISSKFDNAEIPEGFIEAEYEYEGKTYTVIKGEKKGLIAMWLKIADSSEEPADGEEGESSTPDEGFYIYDEESNEFYDMDNIYIKSRMYTVVEMATPDPFLNDFETLELQVIDETVTVWVLDEENSLYLLYAMNWEGDTSLYCYDDVEKCFQRYIIDSAAATQLEGANKAINDLENKNRKLIKKYNSTNSIKYKIIAVLAILVVIYTFVVINLVLSLKSKRLDEEDDDTPSKPSKKSKRRKARDSYERPSYVNDYDEDDEDDDDDELFKLVEDDSFIIVNNNNVRDREQEEKNSFGLNSGKIDISSNIIDEMEKTQKEAEPVVNIAPERVSFKAEKEEPFNEESLKDILSTAFPKEEQEEDDDGFTFI